MLFMKMHYCYNNLLIFIIICILSNLQYTLSSSSPSLPSSSSSLPSVLIVGSVNADIIVPIENYPNKGETIVAPYHEYAGQTIAGGKGCNQAVGVSRLNSNSIFVCQFGNDANAKMLENILKENNVNIKYCKTSNKPSGLGLVFLEKTGSVSAIVIGGSNQDWPKNDILLSDINNILDENNIACILLQMEVPQYVNDIVAEAAAFKGIPIFQDIGGENRDISDDHLKKCTYISPNLTELKRLTKMDCNNIEQIIDAAKHLQTRGAKNILVTLGEQGSVLIEENGEITKQQAILIDKVVDETGAGDNFRGSFVVSHFVQKKSIKESLVIASAAGAHSVSKLGAIPSMATPQDVANVLSKIRGGCTGDHPDDSECPYLFASRLNSMKDRLDLCQPGEDNGGVLGYIARQGRIKGLNLVDFNYPQHITSPIVTAELKKEILEALHKVNLKCGAICLRFSKAFQAGAFTNPIPEMRKKAVQITKEACEWSLALGANEVVVWSAFCGYDYPLQVDYNSMWDSMVAAFQEVCDSYPQVKISLEYKPTDENTRFFAVPSTGSAQMLINAVNRDNFGLTLDYGHMLMAGENPAQSVAYVNRNKNILFGVQLGDGYGRLGAEDGLAFGSLSPKQSIEFVYWLIKTNFKGHIYFDTFPRNEDPIRECEYNIRQFKKMYKLAHKMLKGEDSMKVNSILSKQDAMAMLEYLESNSSI